MSKTYLASPSSAVITTNTQLTKVKTILVLVLYVLFAFPAKAQTGSSVFAFMDIPMTARFNSYGGTNVSVRDGDLGMSLSNPALLNEQTDKVLQLNYAYYMQGINLGSVLYGHNYKANYFGVAIHYLDYGKMPYADEYGNLTGGSFSARDVLMNLMYARQLGEMFSVGVSLKPIYSHYARQPCLNISVFQTPIPDRLVNIRH